MPVVARAPRLVGLLAIFAAAASPSRARADAELDVKARIEPASLSVGQKGRLVVEIGVPEGYHLWGFDPGPGPQALSLALSKGAPLVLEGAWHGAEPVVRYDRGFKADLARYETREVKFERVVRLDRAPGADERTTLLLRGQICTEEQCVGQRVEVKLPFTASPAVPEDRADPVLGGVALKERGAGGDAVRTTALAASPGKVEPASVVAAAQPGAAQGSGLDANKEQGILGFLLTAFLFGLGALATPCVFPAIPLTVSFFSKYSEESFGRGARLAATYAATMVATFTGAGIVISIIFGAAGLQQFASHPVFNLALGLVLVFFSLNLLGWFEIRVPGFVLAFANGLERRWGRSSLVASPGAPKSSATDYVVVSVAAVTSTTVFFTCTVAFVGLMLVEAVKGEWFWPTLGMLAFSLAFSLPFFLLALFPQAARRLRGASGGWLNATRVMLGFFELAAATKFLSNVDLHWNLHILTREVVLAFWIPLFAVAGLYLLGKVKMGEGGDGTEEHPSVPRVLASVAMFGLAIYLAAGLFASRPFGGWADAFLPPVNYPGSSGVMLASGREGAGEGLAWGHDLKAGRERAKTEGKLVFVNYTGITCTNCRFMEGAVFPRAEIAALLRPMVLVELYTDRGTDADDAARADQLARFGTAALPFYSVERADGTVLGTFASSTNDPGEFERFLKAATAKATDVLLAEPKKAEPAALTDAAKPSGVEPLVLKTRRLADGAIEPAIVPGRWTLINFWASYCSPCIAELREFLVARGHALEAQGGRFVTVAVESAEGVEKAREIAKGLGLASSSALYISDEFGPGDLDARFGFGSGVPYTVLVAPNGEIVWKHAEKLEEPELKAKLTCWVGEDAKPAPDKPWVPKKCG